MFLRKISVAMISAGLFAGVSFAHAVDWRDPVSSGRESRTIPFTSYHEISHLPPRLVAVFQVDCSEVFEGVERKDQYDSRTDTVVITLAGRVHPLPHVSCQGVSRLVEADAGLTYSGRRYEIGQLTEAVQ